MKYKKYGNYYDSLSRKEYYERSVFPQSLSFFSEIDKFKNTALSIDAPVGFRELKFGDTPDSVSKALGEPRFVIENFDLSSLIFFYKENIYNNRVVTQIHFLKDEFFSACYTFRHHSQNEMLLIKRVLFEKHANIRIPVIGKYNRIVGRENNSISIIDNVNLNILYLWGHEKVHREISAIISSDNLQIEAKHQSAQIELLMKL